MGFDSVIYSLRMNQTSRNLCPNIGHSIVHHRGKVQISKCATKRASRSLKHIKYHDKESLCFKISRSEMLVGGVCFLALLLHSEGKYAVNYLRNLTKKNSILVFFFFLQHRHYIYNISNLARI